MLKYVIICALLYYTSASWFGGSSGTEAPSAAASVEEKSHLGHESHTKDGIHNPDFDHEEFLGPDQAEEFKKLTPEESKERLGEIYTKMDKNKDGFVTKEELVDWIRHVRKTYIERTTNEQWERLGLKEKEKVSWDEYEKLIFGFLDSADHGYSEKEVENFKKAKVRDHRRFTSASEDTDVLSKAGFRCYLHPEECEHSKKLVVRETIEELDADGDGLLSFAEFIGPSWEERNEPGAPMPDWVKTELEYFKSSRDKDNDGKLNADETREWVYPTEYDHMETEANHLMDEADQNRDEKLSREEIMDKYEVFVGSQATDYGQALKDHDEL